MTETLQPPPAAGGPPRTQRRLVRRPDEKVLAGVCAAFARATDTDPLLWRIAIAVLSVFGGTGIALYLLGWLLVPMAGAGPTAVERALRRPDKHLGTVVLLALGAIFLLAVLDNGPGAGALLVLGGIGYLVLRERREGPPEPAPSWYAPPLVMHGPDPAPADSPSWDVTGATSPVGTSQGDSATSTLVTPQPYDSGLTAPGHGAYGANYGGGYGGGTYDTSPFAAWDAPAPVGPTARRRSRLGLLTLSAAAVVAGALLTLRAAGYEQVTVARVLACVLVVLGAGMVVGTWVGRARWLLLPSLLVAAALVPAALLQSSPVPYGAGVGERTWVPGPGEERTSFRLAAGEAELDLRRLDPGALAGRPLSAAVGAGEIVVLVPEDLRVQVDADVRLGDIVVVEPDGDRRSYTDGSGERVQEQFVVGAAGDPTVELDLEVAAGQIEVRRVAS